MNELLSQTTQLLGQSADFLKVPGVSTVFTGLLGWIGKTINKKSAKEKLELIEQGKESKEMIAELESYLRFVLDENETLQKELASKLEEVKSTAASHGVNIKTINNQANINGNENINAQSVENSNININIGHRPQASSPDENSDRN